MSTVLFKEKDLSVLEAGISAKVKALGIRCPFTQEAEPQYPRMMKYLRDKSLKYNLVNYKKEIFPNRLPVEGNEEIWSMAQHRQDLADVGRVHDLEEKFKAGETQKQLPLFLADHEQNCVPFCGVRRDRAMATLIEQEEECVDDFLAIQVYPEHLDGTLVTDREWREHLTWLAGFSNSDQEDVKDPLSLEEKAATLANIVKAIALDYSEQSHVERMHGFLKQLHPKDFGGEHSTAKGLRTKCIRIASELITTKISEESITSAEQLYKAFFPDEVWDVIKQDQRTVQVELGTAASRYLWSWLDPTKKDSMLHKCQAKDVELYMKFHNKQTEETYNKHIEDQLESFTLWNNVLVNHLTCHVLVTKLIIPKSNLGSWDKDRAWVWKPNHKDGARFVEVFKV